MGTKMEKKKVKWLSITLDLVMIIAVVTLGYKLYKPSHPDTGNYDFCMEWEGGITRELIPIMYLRDCYDFDTGISECNIVVDKNQRLFVYINQSLDPSSSYECVRYVKTIIVEPELTAPDIISI